MSESADQPASADSDPPRADLAAAPLVETAEGKPEPTEALMAELRRRSEQFETASPEEILRWATDRFGDRLTMGTAFGPEGMVIIDLLSRIAPRTHLFNLDTGYQFAETLALRDRIAERYGMEVELLRPELSVAEYEAQHGGPVYKTDTTQCCFDRKIRVLQRAAMGRHAWISAIRRDQSENRRGADIISWDRKFGLVKVNPLANCTKKDIWRAIMERNIPYNPLHDQGYTSIGCWPCTRAITFGEDERAGRWSGTAKTECGLHTPE
jgi:phosphoadenosine phosphosulfate reductase